MKYLPDLANALPDILKGLNTIFEFGAKVCLWLCVVLAAIVALPFVPFAWFIGWAIRIAEKRKNEK